MGKTIFPSHFWTGILKMSDPRLAACPNKVVVGSKCRMDMYSKSGTYLGDENEDVVMEDLTASDAINDEKTTVSQENDNKKGRNKRKKKKKKAKVGSKLQNLV